MCTDCCLPPSFILIMLTFDFAATKPPTDGRTESCRRRRCLPFTGGFITFDFFVVGIFLFYYDCFSLIFLFGYLCVFCSSLITSLTAKHCPVVTSIHFGCRYILVHFLFCCYSFLLAVYDFGWGQPALPQTRVDVFGNACENFECFAECVYCLSEARVTQGGSVQRKCVTA